MTRKNAKIRVAAVFVDCPHCDEHLEHHEEYEHNECVFPPAGVVSCENCHRHYVVPDLSTVFRSVRVRP